MEFNDLLAMSGLDPKNVALMLHCPGQMRDKAALMALADDCPDLFEVYQDNHPPGAEATLKRRKFAASFVVGASDDAHFVGLYGVAGWVEVPAADLDADPRRTAMRNRYPGRDFAELKQEKGLDGRAVFDLVAMPELSEFRGRLVVHRKWARNYMRKAENTRLPILEIRREPRLTPPAPEWRDFILSADEIRTLPREWAARLREWRGVYLIIDQRDRMAYVGSACGADNILSRWRAHVAGDHGVTTELTQRDPASFRFSILERSSPDLDREAVNALEQSWKRRLDTLEHGLNRN